MNHVFSEIGPEWYVDGLPVSEIKRRYEAHDAMTLKLAAARALLQSVVHDGYLSDTNTARIHSFLEGK